MYQTCDLVNWCAIMNFFLALVSLLILTIPNMNGYFSHIHKIALQLVLLNFVLRLGQVAVDIMPSWADCILDCVICIALSCAGIHICSAQAP